jgi:hypothetical protein
VNPEGEVTGVAFEYGPVVAAAFDSSGVPAVAAPPITYTSVTPSQSVGPDFSNHVVTATVTGLLPNTVYHVRAVATNSAGTTTGSDQTLTTPADPPPPAPVLGKSFDASVVSGLVLVRLPHGQPLYASDVDPHVTPTPTQGPGFVPLTEARALPPGTQIDARLGTIRLITATGQRRKTQTGTFSEGLFGVSQDRRGVNKGLTTLALLEGAFPGAPTYTSCKAKKVTDSTPPGAHSARSSTVLQLLRASAHGRFQTRGRYSAATVLGTAWTIADRCDGTLITVQRDTVQVTDFVRRISVLVSAGHTYLAPASRRTRR